MWIGVAMAAGLLLMRFGARTSLTEEPCAEIDVAPFANLRLFRRRAEDVLVECKGGQWVEFA